QRDIADIREILRRYSPGADVYLGGEPMIAADMRTFIRNDIIVFGSVVVLVMSVVLLLVFRDFVWVILPFGVAICTGLFTVGVLGILDWPVSVVSSNFLSLILIFAISLTVHLIVRYRELVVLHPEKDQQFLVAETLRSKIAPCAYTVITTMVAFGSLVLSNIRPVIDFGWMMAIALAASFFFAFTIFPAALILLGKRAPRGRESVTALITENLGYLARSRPKSIVAVALGLFIVGSMGLQHLSVENRFIDYFHEETEIYQGMVLIDEQLGGTTPLDIIIDAPEASPETRNSLDEEDSFDSFFDDGSDAGITTSSYWFNTDKLRDAAAVHEYLDALPDTGKVLSLHTTIKALDDLGENNVIDDFFLSLLYNELPDSIRTQLIQPYFSEEHDQLRFSIRVRESDATLDRQSLIETIERDLASFAFLDNSRVSVGGLLVLYNNMLQSLFRSQIATLGVVLLVVAITFVVLFRSVAIALIAIIPNMIVAALVLGVMGWTGTPLNIMTITIAAIAVGIAVDDTIHYIHRFAVEFKRSNAYGAAIERAHSSIGKAMYYTTFTITVGFLVLMTSNFTPTVIFGLLAGFAMVSALVCDLLILPALFFVLRPYGKGAD
ncbi:MAG: MMPL family transporter, partial [Pseudomonadota bacterium]